MSIDRTLKIKGALSRHRNVLTRAERIEKLKDEERWSKEQSVFGLPKVVHRKSHAGRKIKEELEKPAEGEAAAATTEASTTAAAAGKTPTAKTQAAKTPAAKTPEHEAKTKKG
jgi:small basic protein (TIGR04137 family)